MLLKIIIGLIGCLIAIEIMTLFWLYLSVARYKTFWQEKAQQPGEITYLALGDSAAQGIGATSPMRGYVGLIVKRLEVRTGKKVRVINLSSTGARISDVLNEQLPLASDIKADYVTIEVGANNVRDFSENRFRHEFAQLLSKLPQGTYVSDLPLFNSRPSLTKPAKAAGAIIRQLVAQDPNIRLVELEKQTTAHQSIFGFAPDLFHPNNLSYKNWADAFWDEINSNKPELR